MNQVPNSSQAKSAQIFPTTHWTTLLKPIQERTDEAQIALNKLFEIYRKPIVSFISTLVRNPGHAEDIAQDFIAKILEREDLAKADRSKGKFRCYLSTSIRNHVTTHYNAENARKRKALVNAASLDESPLELGHPNDAEKEFTRQWWRATIDESVRRLRSEWEAAGKGALYRDLEPFLWDRKAGQPIKDIAKDHQISATALSLRKMRFEQRLAELILEVVGETVGTATNVQEEIRLLLQDP